MQRYVVGFLFSADQKYVALIEKARPKWQAGFWNGIGGKVEPGEDPAFAMHREFHEETGVILLPNRWEHTVTLRRADHDNPELSETKASGSWEVLFFRAFGPEVNGIASVTDEIVAPFAVTHLFPAFGGPPMIPNLRWLIQLNLSDPTRDPYEFPITITERA